MKKYILSIFSIICALNLNAQCEDNGNYWNDSWVSCTTSPSPNPLRGDTTYWLLYDFEQAQFIDTAYFWNANRTGESAWGAKDVAIDYSIDGSTWVELGVYEFPQAPETENYEGFLGPEFDSVFVEKILITVLSTHDGGNCASIAEVQFHINESACYGIIDECGICDGPGATTWYIDADMDGLGDPNNSIDDCTQPLGYVENKEDLCDNGYSGWGEMAMLFTDNGCTACHGAGAAGGLDLRTYTSTAAGGNICGTDLLTGTKLVDIINISNYDGCGIPISFPSMNDRVGNQLDAQELAQLQAWVDGGAPELCTDYCLDFFTEETVLICAGDDYTFPDGTTQNNITSNLNYISDLTSSQGCDSTIVTNLEVSSTYSLMLGNTICEGGSYTFPDGTVQNNITADLQQMSMLTSVNGCDSLVTTNLAVVDAYMINENFPICQGESYTFPDGTLLTNITSDQVYNSQLISSLGCDSLILTELLVKPIYSIIANAQICEGGSYTFPDGTVQNNISSDVQQMSMLTSVDGCDSLITTNLLLTVIDTSVSVLGFDLTANAIATTYQWLDCENNFAVIPGASNQTFSALENGSYAVAITQDACVDTSNCHTVLSVSIDKVEEALYGLRPNPVREILYITGEFHQAPSVTIYNALGQVCSVPFNVNDLSLNVNDLAAGVYLLKLQVKEQVFVLEFVKQW